MDLGCQVVGNKAIYPGAHSQNYHIRLILGIAETLVMDFLQASYFSSNY